MFKVGDRVRTLCTINNTFGKHKYLHKVGKIVRVGRGDFPYFIKFDDISLNSLAGYNCYVWNDKELIYANINKRI